LIGTLVIIIIMSPRDDGNEKLAVEIATTTAMKEPPSKPTAAWWSFASIRERIEDEMDQQRHERLAQCRSLESALKDCIAKKPNRPRLEDLPSGIRMVRYFDWRDVTDDPYCQREAHSVWACRAVSLKCGQELLQVRDCFHNQCGTDTITGSPDKKAILRHRNGSAAYESYLSSEDGSDSTNPCAKLQQTLGHCVSANAHALLERDHARRQK
jgi:hypothetical protein